MRVGGATSQGMILSAKSVRLRSRRFDLCLILINRVNARNVVREQRGFTLLTSAS